MNEIFLQNTNYNNQIIDIRNNNSANKLIIDTNHHHHHQQQQQQQQQKYLPNELACSNNSNKNYDASAAAAVKLNLLEKEAKKNIININNLNHLSINDEQQINIIDTNNNRTAYLFAKKNNPNYSTHSTNQNRIRKSSDEIELLVEEELLEEEENTDDEEEEILEEQVSKINVEFKWV